MKYPQNVNVYINDRCNLKCIYCYEKNKNKLKNENLSDFEIFCKNAKGKNINTITITGGEPLLSNNVYEYVDIAQKNFLKIELLTNGTIPINKKYLKKFQAITFSYDGNLGVMQRQRTITEKQFFVLKENIDECVKNNVSIKINCVVTKNNLTLFHDDLFPFLSLPSKMLTELKIHAVDTEKKDLSLSREDLDYMIDSIKDLLNHNEQKIKITINFADMRTIIKLKKNRSWHYPIWFDLLRNSYFITRDHQYSSLDELLDNYAAENSLLLNNYLLKIKNEEGYYNPVTMVNL